MRFDVSEMKTLAECSRKWEISSRNAMHLKPRGINSNLAFGTLMHEALHALYMGSDPEKVLEQALRELPDSVQKRVMENIITGYVAGPLKEDLEKYVVMDIEHAVHLKFPEIPDDEICGSIDMIVWEPTTNCIHGFEHKSAAKFRPQVYIALDEQPRVYFMALKQLVDDMNHEALERWAAQGKPVDKEPVPYKVGNIYLNEVKKVQKKFEYQRTACHYSEEVIAKFKQRLIATAHKIHALQEGALEPCPEPSYMKCQMCDFANICEMYQDRELDEEALLEEFSEEFIKRDVDHLDEKVERRIK